MEKVKFLYPVEISDLTVTKISGVSSLPAQDNEGNALSSSETYIPQYIDGKWVAVKLSVYTGATI